MICPWTGPELSRDTPRQEKRNRFADRVLALCVLSDLVRMASSDRGFRALAQDSPEAIVALLRCGGASASGAFPPDARITRADVDDSHLGALTPVIDADWIARVGEDAVVHVECQGYRDTTFAERLLRYHLHVALRYWGLRVHTFAIWLVTPPAAQRAEELRIGTSIVVRVAHVVVAELSAASLLESPETACFAAGADPGAWTDAELCARVATALAASGASWERKHMAVIAAALSGRYDLMLRAMEEKGMQPIVIEDLVKFGEDRGEARGEVRGLAGGVLDALDARGFTTPDALRARVLAETSIDQLRTWLKRAVVAASVDDVLGER